jgi:CHAD domain-containing protein
MELELALHPDDAMRLLHLKQIDAVKTGRIRTQATRVIWHDSPTRELAADRRALAESQGTWQLERLTPGVQEAWPPGAPPPCLGEADEPSALPGTLPEPLAPVAALEGKSTSLLLAQDRDPVSLTLLRGVLRTVTAEHAICRLRVDGPDAAVHALTMALAAELRLSIPHASLAAEALATVSGSIPEPRRLGAAELPGRPYPSVADSFRHVLGHLTDVILHFAPTAASGQEDTEPVHQMRVAVRRARSAIAVYRDALACPAFDTADDQLKIVGNHLAPVRNWDVFATETAPAVTKALPDDAKLGRLIVAAQRRRREADAALRAWLAGPEFRGIGIGLAWLAASGSWIVPAEAEQQALLATPLPDFAAAILQRRWKKLMAAGKHIETLDIPSLHGLRLRAKRARYAAEIFVPLFPGKASDRFLRRLTALQKHLGILNDGATAELLLRDISTESGRHGYAAGLVLGYLAAAASGIRPKIFRVWRKFADASPFWS